MSYIAPRSKVLWHVKNLDMIRDGKRPPPVTVEVDLSNRCSLGCQWCHMAYTHTRGPIAGKMNKPIGQIPGGDLMDFNLARNLLYELSFIGTNAVTWTGGGEPTLHPDFDEITAFAHDRGLQQGIYTHGGHISRERARQMKRRFTWVYISLDSAHAESYKALKGVNRFGDVCNGIRHLVDAPGDAVIGVGFLINADNYEEIDDMVALAKGLGADYCQFRPTVLYDPANPGEVAEDTGWMNDAILMLDGYTDDSFVQVDLSRFQQYQDWQGHGYKTCWWTGLQAVVTPNGKVWTCINKREFPDAELGDLNENTFIDIWNRNGLHPVNGTCRVMCRGHLPNQTIEQVMVKPKHANFV